MRHVVSLFTVAWLLAVGHPGGAQPPAELRWELTRADVSVRASEDGRYLVEAYLDLAPPPEAHRDFDPIGLDFRFHGDPERHQLAVFRGTVNGREVERIVAIDPEGRYTQVLLRIGEAQRTAPLLVHLVATLDRHRGRVALPVIRPDDGAEIVVRAPDGTVTRPESMPLSLVVNAKEARAPGLPLFQVVMVACFVGTILFVIVILRRRPAKDRPPGEGALPHHEGDGG
jgi:hypothetical protein